MKAGDLGDTLVSVIGSSGGTDLLQEAAELAIDGLLEEGILRDIPLVGGVAKLYGIAKASQGYIFTKKLKRFLTELATVPSHEREEFGKRLESEPGLRESTADALLLMLDKLDDLEKAPLLARAFAGYVTGHYDINLFRRLASAIDRCLLRDLAGLGSLNFSRRWGEEESLASVGLLAAQNDNDDERRRRSSIGPRYIPTQLGELFIRVVLR